MTRKEDKIIFTEEEKKLLRIMVEFGEDLSNLFSWNETLQDDEENYYTKGDAIRMKYFALMLFNGDATNMKIVDEDPPDAYEDAP